MIPDASSGGSPPSGNPASQSIFRIDDVHDPRLDGYRSLKDKHLRIRQGLFVAEGEEVVRRLLASRFDVQSLLLTPAKLDRLRRELRPAVPVYVASLEQMEHIAGFHIHRGAVACGLRPPRMTFDDALRTAAAGRIVIALEGVGDAQNVGVIIRNAAAFGASLVVLHNCCDPLYRRAIRVSMGNVFSVPVFESHNLEATLTELHRRLAMPLIAADPAPDSEPLAAASLPDRAVLIFGAEAAGLSPAIRQMCDRRLGIPMHPGTDSVNVAVATGIFLYAFTQPAPRPAGATIGG